MDLYTDVSYELARTLTKRYSTSFSMSSTLFDASISRHIYAIYGMVRIADEVVDSYRGDDVNERIGALHKDVLQALETGYHTNPILHAFASTARLYEIGAELIDPFFESMRIDVTAHTFTLELYKTYIYGSAEVVGLMCLKVFTPDPAEYEKLRPGAQALGAAYQKVNFLRDIKADYEDLNRVYFPGVVFEEFNEKQKTAIIREIKADFKKAQKAADRLPMTARKAVYASILYYSTLLQKLEKTSARQIVSKRIRVNNARKLFLLLKARAARYGE